MSSPSLRLLLVDSQAIMLEGLNALLSPITDLNIVGEAQDGWSAVQMARTHRPDIIIMDLMLPRMNGIDAIIELSSRRIDTSVLVLTADNSETCVREALRAGAAGYILKSCKLTELLLAIRSITSGNAYLSPSISSNVINGYVNKVQTQRFTSQWCNLTSRERQILQLIAEGSSSKKIAMDLHLSIKTVEKHRSNLRNKLDIHNTHGLITYWETHGLSPDRYERHQHPENGENERAAANNPASSMRRNRRSSDTVNESGQSQ